MTEVFLNDQWICLGMFALFGISMTVRVILGCLYGKMIRETENMAVTKNTVLRQCKLKFVNCFELNNGVSNVPVFVEKFLSRMSVGPFGFEEMYHLSEQTMLLAVVLDGVEICRAIGAGKKVGEILPFYILCFAGLYLYFSVSAAVDIRRRRKILKINLVDYLENHLSARIGVTKGDLEMLEAERPGRKEIELMPMERRTVSIGQEELIEGAGSKENFTGSLSRETPSEGAFGTEDLSGNAVPGSNVTQEEFEALLKEFLAI